MAEIIKKEIKFVSLYQRVSTSNQEDANTVQNQGMVLEEFTNKNGYIIVDKYTDEGWSGDTLARPELDRMRQTFYAKFCRSHILLRGSWHPAVQLCVGLALVRLPGEEFETYASLV